MGSVLWQGTVGRWESMKDQDRGVCMKKSKITKISFVEIAESLSEKITAYSRGAKNYGHPTGTGDERERALKDALRSTLPEKFGVDKCRLIDSNGHISSEFDIVIYEKDYAVTPLEVKGRKLLPIESVYFVIEVKSKLTPKEYKKFLRDITELDDFKRYYEPIGLHPPGIFTPERKKILAEGVGPQTNFPDAQNCPRIGIIARSLSEKSFSHT